MIPFKEIELADRGMLLPRLAGMGSRDCNASFANLYCWQFLTRGGFAWIEGELVVRLSLDGDRVIYLVPGESVQRVAIIECLIEEARERGDVPRLFGEIPRLSSWLDEAFPGKFLYRANRDYFDYIYERESLVELKGKHLQAKRNHVNKFRREHAAHEFVPLTPGIVPECLALEEAWYRQRAGAGSLLNERRALTLALQHIEELELLGGAIRVEGKVVAFAYGSPVTFDTFDIHIEKADSSIDGAYNVINQELARRVPGKYRYINREEDLGLPGLRKAKLSYRPVILLEKGLADYRP